MVVRDTGNAAGLTAAENSPPWSKAVRIADGICLGDDEQDQSMGGRVSISKLIPVT